MAQLDTTRNYNDGEALLEADLDAFLDDIETFINVTKINDDNIQNNGITGSTKLLNQSVTEEKLAANSVSTLKIVDEAVTDDKIADDTITFEKLAASLAAKLVPTGSVMPYTAASAPTAWLLCDGTAVSRTTYAALFAVIGETFGQGDNSTTFNVPDFRGRFLRMVDGATARDPNAATRTAMNTGGNTGDNIGSLQGYATARPIGSSFSSSSDGAHTHTYTRYGTSVNVDPNSISGVGSVLSSSSTQTTSSSGAHTHTITSGGDSETRPINAYVNYIIKI